jgi:hypothetical protein
MNRQTKSGVKNVIQHQDKWCVRFSVARRTRHFGCFATIDEAAVVAAKIRAELHGKFARDA